MTIELCERCCKININDSNKIYFPVKFDINHVVEFKEVRLCNDCTLKAFENSKTFIKGFTSERIENIQALNLF